MLINKYVNNIETFKVKPTKNERNNFCFSETLQVVESKLIHLDPSKKIVSETFEALAERIRNLRGNINCILSRVQFKHLANECGLHGQSEYRDALQYLERVGVCLAPQTENVCVITKHYWFSHQLGELLSHPDGMVETKSLGKPSSLASFLRSICQNIFCA